MVLSFLKCIFGSDILIRIISCFQHSAFLLLFDSMAGTSAKQLTGFFRWMQAQCLGSHWGVLNTSLFNWHKTHFCTLTEFSHTVWCIDICKILMSSANISPVRQFGKKHTHVHLYICVYMYMYVYIFIHVQGIKIYNTCTGFRIFFWENINSFLRVKMCLKAKFQWKFILINKIIKYKQKDES